LLKNQFVIRQNPTDSAKVKPEPQADATTPVGKANAPNTPPSSPKATKTKERLRSVQDLLPADAKIIETETVKESAKPRTLVLWMLQPERHSSGVDNCPSRIEGDYWEGPTKLSLINEATSTIINTVEIVKGQDDGTFRIPFSVPDGLYRVPQPDSDGKGKPKVLSLVDLIGEGIKAQFPLFLYEACGIVSTAVWGYDSSSDRAVSYAVEIHSGAETHVRLWTTEVFAMKPVRPRYWHFTWSPGHGADFSFQEEVSFDPSKKAFIQTEIRSAPSVVQTTSPGAAPAVYEVRLRTTKGDITLRITRAWALFGADRFYTLVRSGFFTEAPFFRVIPGCMTQFGISPKPALNKAWRERALVDDPKPYHSNRRGTLTFETTGRPNSRDSQLFINLKDNAFLDSQGFAPIGQVIEGMEVVDQFFSGYGETANKQGEILNGGQAYLDRYMPRLDKIIAASIVP
jgi:peptidyl-prolyl cis-trans isomerase A (cyclophilin A)